MGTIHWHRTHVWRLRSLALCGGEMRCWRHGDYTPAQDDYIISDSSEESANISFELLKFYFEISGCPSFQCYC